MKARKVVLVVAALLGLSAYATPVADAAFPQHAKISRDGQSGNVEFVGTPPGRPIERPPGFSAASPPADVARAFLNANARAFGLGRAAALRSIGSEPQPKGATAVRLQQSVSGIDVIGGQFVVQVDKANNVLSALGEALPVESFDGWASLSAAEAEQRALESVARQEDVTAAMLDARADGLRVYDSHIMGSPALGGPVLTWAVEVGDGAAVRRLVLVHAHRGSIAESIDRSPEARQRTVCDANGTTGHYPCTTPVLEEGGSYGGGVADVQLAYDYAGATYDYFLDRFGRDSLDGDGMPLKSTVRWCPGGGDCPNYENAFWDGQQMVYGTGYARADDVVGHELAHGFTEFSSNLFYANESGAINEAMSDVFGEIVDQLTADSADDPSDKWLLGEALPIGHIRNMRDPTDMPPGWEQPDFVHSSHWWTGMGDSGGVHVNSGVANKAAYLIADGGSFNGQTVAGIGLEKMGRVFYAVNTGFLTSASNYEDLGNALGQACDNLIGSHGFRVSDCESVRKAVVATQMGMPRPEATDEPECPTGQAAQYVFSDDLEGAVRWTAGSHWYLPQSDQPWDGWDPSWRTSGEVNMWGDDWPTSSDHSIALSNGVAIPAEAFLSFQHAHRFQPGHDGGVVEASTDGSTWTDVSTADYTGTLSSSHTNPNPLGGREAFTGGMGYRRTVMPLAALAGQTARFRLRIGTDSSSYHDGWFVDDVRIGTCVADTTAPAVAATEAPADVTVSGAMLKGSVTPNGKATSYQFQWGTTSDYDRVAPASPASAGSGDSPVAVSQSISGLAAETTYFYRVVAVQDGKRTYGSNVTFTTPAAPTGGPNTGGTDTDGTNTGGTDTGDTSGDATPVTTILKGIARKGSKRAKVRCSSSAAGATCRVTYRRAARKRKVRVRLVKAGTVLASGSVKRANRRGRVRISGPAELSAGSYRLVIKVRKRTVRLRLRLAVA